MIKVVTRFWTDRGAEGGSKSRIQTFKIEGNRVELAKSDEIGTSPALLVYNGNEFKAVFANWTHAIHLADAESDDGDAGPGDVNE